MSVAARGAAVFPDSVALPPGRHFIDAVAAGMLSFCAAHADPGASLHSGDLSACRVLVPALPIVAEVRQALVRAAGRPLLLPQFCTLGDWLRGAPLTGLPAPMADSERLVLLHEALRQRAWFDEGALWGIAAEMAGLFDELTAAAVQLPESETALLAQLEAAYALRACAPLAFEARVVHELWRALATSGRPDVASVERLRLARLAQTARQPLLVLLDAAPEESLGPAERDFLLAYGERQPLVVFHPAPRRVAGAGDSPLLAVLAAAWPEDAVAEPLYERAAALAAALPESPLAGRLQLVATAGREQEARAAVARVAGWLDDGLRRIVLITQDRLTARRVRALLEREGILAVDETGWKLATSRAAAAFDALLETVAGGAYYRDVLDLCKSPFVFAAGDDASRRDTPAAVLAIEAAIRKSSVRVGLPRIRQALPGSGASPDATRAAGLLLDRVEAACALLRARPAPLARWLERLDKALQALDAPAALLEDAAGTALLELLAARRQELAANGALFSFASWRDWLNREFESATFRDGGIASSIVLTPLNAVCLRRFDAALLLGGDARQLAPAAGGAFFNQAVRRELGLPTRAEAERELRRDLELLLATVPQVCVTWQSEHDGEANLLAPDLDLLATLHSLAWGDDLRRPPLPGRREAEPAPDSAPALARHAAPSAPAALLPTRVSVSAYASLIACPYRFFARHVLALGEMDEVSEAMEKSDYGALVHRVLERFHERHPRIAALGDDEALAALRACVAEVFSPAVAADFLALGWRMRWEKRLAAYLDWQRAREAAGWHWARAEQRVARVFDLAGGEAVELYGRIDRIDEGDDGVALLDYKTQTARGIRERLAEDVQLPAYALLHGDAAQTAYVALDDERIEAVGSGAADEDPMPAARRQGERLRAVFSALRAGAAMPAHGSEKECAHCEMSGLCRRDHVGDEH